jgi:hypothetical protein
MGDGDERMTTRVQHEGRTTSTEKGVLLPPSLARRLHEFLGNLNLNTGAPDFKEVSEVIAKTREILAVELDIE